MSYPRRFFWLGAAPVLLTTVFCLLALSLFVGHLSGCAGTPLSSGQDVSQRAYALYGTFVIVEEQGARLVQDTTVTSAIRHSIQTADAHAKPIADALASALRSYENVTAGLKTGETTTAQLATTNANLGDQIQQASGAIQSLVTAVHSTSGSTP